MARQNPVWQLWNKPRYCTERFRFAVGFLHLSTRGVVTLLGPCFKTGGSGPSTLAESPAWADRECRRPDKGTLKCTPTHQAATSHPAPAKKARSTSWWSAAGRPKLSNHSAVLRALRLPCKDPIRPLLTNSTRHRKMIPTLALHCLPTGRKKPAPVV
jgi:hypothetical protein